MNNATTSALVRRLATQALAEADVIPWSSPVPAFGDPTRAAVATLGLNPSNREFVDETGHELQGEERRFHTLGSFGLSSWEHAEARHLELIREACSNYFAVNPYDGWFRKLDRLLAGADLSYYGTRKNMACHLDLIPFATSSKWSDLTRRQRSALLAEGRTTLAHVLRDSEVKALVLNGISVVTHFSEIADVELHVSLMKGWTLPRTSGRGVNGFAYAGSIRSLAGVDLGREVLVLGYNHNIQSSFGVTAKVVDAIGAWVAASLRGATW